MERDDLDRAQDNFQDAAGDAVEEAGNVMEETWDEARRSVEDDDTLTTEREA